MFFFWLNTRHPEKSERRKEPENALLTREKHGPKPPAIVGFYGSMLVLGGVFRRIFSLERAKVVQ